MNIVRVLLLVMVTLATFTTSRLVMFHNEEPTEMSDSMIAKKIADSQEPVVYFQG